MKRQADGVSSPSKGVTQPEAVSKRIKLQQNEDQSLEDETNERIECPLKENSQNHNLKENEHNSLPCELTDSCPNENGLINDSSNETSAKYSENNSEFLELHHTNSQGNSVLSGEETEEDEGLQPPVLNHCDHDLQNNESTDSFQSEGSDEEKNSSQGSSNEVSEKQISQELTNGGEPSVNELEFAVENYHMNIDVVDSLKTSHIQILEIEGHTDTIFAVAADKDYILSASVDTTIKVWDTKLKMNISTFSGHSNTVTSVLLLNANQSKSLRKKLGLKGGSRIAITASLDCNIKCWSVQEGKELASLYTFNGITCLAYLESECLIVVGTEGGKLELWEVGAVEAKISERAQEDAITDIKVQDNYIYSVSTDGSAKAWVYEDEEVYPLYAKYRKEVSSDRTGFKPVQWKALAVSENVMYLGDCTNNIKVLDWKKGHLRMFRNQIEEQAICESIVIEDNVMFTTCYNYSCDTSAINVWKVPDMEYICTLSNDTCGHIRSLAINHTPNKELQLICGGQKLCVWEFDFSGSSNLEEDGYVRTVENVGLQIEEKPCQIKSSVPNENPQEVNNNNNSSNRWCNVM